MNIAALLVSLVVAAPGGAEAQPSWSARVDEVRQDVRLHAGPFYVKPTLVLKELGTDSNVFNAAGEPASDFTFTVTPQADTFVPIARRALLKLTTAADLVYFAEYETERSVDPQIVARGEGYLTRLMLFGEAAYLNTRQRPNYEVDVRSRHVENAATLGAELAVTSRFLVTAQARRSEVRYDADAAFGTALQRTLNTDREGVQFTARHRLTSLTTIASRVDLFRDRFEYSPVRDSRSYRVMPGVEFRPQALLKGSAYVGYRKFTPEHHEVLPDFEGLVAELGLSYTLLGATSFGATYRRDLTYSYEEFQPFFIDQTVGASVRRALGDRFDVMGSVDRHRYDYQRMLTADAAVPIAPSPIDTTWNYTASVGYRLRPQSRLAFGVSYWQRDSTTRRFREYDNLRVGISIASGF
jgi:putative beta-barrel porin BBP2